MSSKRYFLRYLFFIATGLIWSLRKNLPAIKATIAPMLAARVQSKVPQNASKSMPAAIAKLTPGRARRTLPATVAAT